MTTLTVEIDKARDLSALKEFIAQLGLNYEIDEQEELNYTDEVKQTLDNRYQEYKEGKVQMISEEESREEILRLLASKK